MRQTMITPQEEIIATLNKHKPSVNPFDADIITYIEAINSISRKKITTYLKKHKVNYQQWRILKSIYLNLAATPAKISETTYTDSSTISRQLELLEAKGLVIRDHSKKDRRVVNLSLSLKGQKIAEDGMNYTDQLINAIRQTIGTHETEIFHEFLYSALHSTVFSSV